MFACSLPGNERLYSNFETGVERNVQEGHTMTGIKEEAELMTTREVVLYLGVTRQTIWNWVNAGILLKKMGMPDGRARFDRKAVEALAEGAPTRAVASYLGVSCCTIRNWSVEGILPGERRTPNGHRRFDMDTVKAFAANRKAVMTTGEVADYCGVWPNTIIRWADLGELPEKERTSGGHRRFDRNAVEVFANARRGNK